MTTDKNNNRTVYFKMRVTQEEYEMIRKNAKSFGGISSYIRAAIAEYSNQKSKQTVDFMYDLFRFHFEYADDISCYASSLNQSVLTPACCRYDFNGRPLCRTCFSNFSNSNLLIEIVI